MGSETRTSTERASSAPALSVEDRLWMMQQELRTFMARVNEQEIERIIDVAVPIEWVRGHLARYEFALPAVAGRRVLDMACGTGYGTHFVARQGAPASILGVDIDPDAVRYAQLRYHDPGLRYDRQDACAHWTDERFDVVISWETIEHVPSPDLMLAAVTRMLEPDGVFYVSTPIRVGGHLGDKPANPYHVREWAHEEFEALVGHFFERVETAAQGFLLPKRLMGVRVPTAWMRTVMQRRGHDVQHFYFTDPKVRRFADVPASWLERPPQVLVAECRSPRSGVDMAIARKLARG